MFTHTHLIGFRGPIIAVCLALLAGCLPRTNPAAPPPISLSATAGNAIVTLSWAASSGATGYNVKRANKSGGPYTQLAASTTSTYIDSTVVNGTAYYYVVSSLNTAGESMNSAEVSATPEGPPPSAPTNIAAAPGNAMVTLTWTASSGAASYNVKRSTTTGGPYTTLATSTSPAYTDSTVINGTTYYYVVSAVNSEGESANSAQVSAIPQIPTVPVAPIQLVATAGNSQVSLTWAASTGATSYHLKRATTSGGPYVQIAAPTSTSYTDTSVTNGTTYYYVVSALNSAGESANSAQVGTTPFVMNPPPTTFGVWINVTPSGVDLTNALCGNFGSQTVQADPAHPSNLYAEFNCQGIWRSTDYGATWSGPINTGTNGVTVSDCGSGITVSISNTTNVPTIYEGCIRGNGIGFWKSVDGGVNWTHYSVGPNSNRQDYYPPVVDPYDPDHLLMTGHEFDSIVESIDGGQSWTNVSFANGMLQNNGTGFIFFINTGNASTTRGNWLWMSQVAGGLYGTWRTANSGGTWAQVDKNEHSVGSAQIYQPDNSGVVYIAGQYSALGDGVLRSTDYGQTWSHVGTADSESVVFGTSKNVYAMYGFPGASTPPFEIAAQPGTGTWVAGPTAAGLDGPAQVAVVNDGTHNILVGAMWTSGVWRYVEP
jgi:fibronectin type 3 domain-containing protein